MASSPARTVSDQAPVALPADLPAYLTDSLVTDLAGGDGPATSSSLPSLVATITGADVPVQPLSVAQSIRLLQALSAVPDPRRRRGRRHSLQSILLIAVSAVLAGARSYAAIGDWAAVTRPAVGVCGRPPHAATIRRVLMSVDPAAVERALTRWVLT